MKYLIVVLMLVLMAVAIWVFADTRIFFSSNRDGDRYSLFVMNPDGTDPVNLYEELDVRADLVWSPDGTKIPLRIRTPRRPEVCERRWRARRGAGTCGNLRHEFKRR